MENIKLNKYFDKAYCINLDRRQDRWQKSQAKFAEMGLNVERYSAFDAEKLPQNIGTKKERGRYACTESHYGVIKEARDNNLDNVLIFEDDCIFPDNFNQNIEQVLDLVSLKWQIIMLGYYMGSNFPLDDFKDKKIIKIPENTTKHDGLWATHAYAVCNSIFDKILNSPNGAFTKNPHESENGYGCIDITYYYKFHGKYDCYALNPSLVDQEKNDTDINFV